MNKDMWLKEFGDNLRSLIQDERLSQKELAEESGIDPADISRYINGQQIPTAPAIVKLAYAINRDVADLIDFGEKIED